MKLYNISLLSLFLIINPKVDAKIPEWVHELKQKNMKNRPEVFGQWSNSQVLIYLIRGHGLVTAKGECFGTLITDMHVITQARCILKDTGKNWKVKPHLKKALVAQVIYLF